MRGFFYVNANVGGQMHLSVIANPDLSRKDRYEIARTIYAETGASSLVAVEALASMIKNAAVAAGAAPVDIVRNMEMFTSRDSASPYHFRWRVPANDAGFQMCLRVVQKMLNGSLGDWCNGATRFHHDGEIPCWATSLGYIAEHGGMLFYV